MDVIADLPADAQPPEPTQQSETLLDHPAVHTESGAVFDATAGDERSDSLVPHAMGGRLCSSARSVRKELGGRATTAQPQTAAAPDSSLVQSVTVVRAAVVGGEVSRASSRTIVSAKISRRPDPESVGSSSYSSMSSWHQPGPACRATGCGLGSGTDQVVAVLGERAQHMRRLVDIHPSQSGVIERGHADGQRVGFVVLAAVPGRKHTHTVGEFRRHIETFDSVIGQLLRQRGAETAGSFDRPDRLGPVSGESA